MWRATRSRESPEAAEVVDKLLGGADAARRAYIRERLAAGVDSQSDRYHQLLAVINGQPPRPARAPDLEWLIAAIDSHRSRHQPRVRVLGWVLAVSSC